MKPPVFSYLRPSTLGEALSYLSKYSDDSKIISGGQSLIPTLNMRLSTPEYLIDISPLSLLEYLYINFLLHFLLYPNLYFF